MTETTSRRELLRSVGAFGAAAVLPDALPPLGQAKRRRVLRFAHLTDTHVRSTGPSAMWLSKALAHAQALAEPPELLFFGGDMIMDAFARPREHVRAEWRVFFNTVRQHSKLPTEYCIGNHDIWGWDRRSGATGEESLYGKKWVQELLGWERTYRSFDKAGWHIVVLDSMVPSPRGYQARLDDEQFEWLKGDLAANRKKPTMIVSHIPIFSTCAMLFTPSEAGGRDWVVPGWLMHMDARKLKNLFRENPQVNLCLSGHVHMVDRVEYNGVTYLCNGAVAGAWWNGPLQETPPGYAMINLYSDGSFEREYHAYGWKRG